MDSVTQAVLGDPAQSLRMFGTVADQESGQLTRYDPFTLTEDLQQTVLSYMSDPPRDAEGYARWLVLLKSRQTGASTTGALAQYPIVAYNAGVEAVVIADNKDRADGLFDRVMLNHAHWPSEHRVEQQSTNEVRSFTTKRGSRIRVLSGHSDAVGIGRSVDLLLASELAFWADAANQFSMMIPALINRKNSLVLQECTPSPMSEASADFWHDQCMDAKQGRGRYLFAFFPFWDSKLCRRKWPEGQVPDSEEQRLLKTYGPRGLTLDNLQFRRVTMDTDPQIRRNVELFSVFYPFDSATCWISNDKKGIPARAFSRVNILLPECPGLTIFEDPQPGSQYLLAVDPSGFGRDHAAFHVMEIWADEWRQVASYGAVTDPNDFAKILFDVGMKYNTAMIGVERNGVGLAQVTLLRHMKYPRIYHDKMLTPGIHKSNHDEWLALLVDGLMDKFTLYGEDTVDQLKTYRGDKLLERSSRAELLSRHGGRRRERHHWDKVSALMVAAAIAPTMPIRYRPVEKPDNVVLFQDMTWEQHEAYRARCQAADRKNQRSGRRTVYKSIRRKR